MTISLAPFRPIETDDLVRVGSPNDGGYVINRRCIARSQLLVGLGISTNWQFETDFQARNPACRVVGVDRTVSSRKLYVRSLRYYGKALALFLLGRRASASARLARAGELRRLSGEFFTFFTRPNNVFLERHITDTVGSASTAWNDGPLTAVLAEYGSRELSVFVKMDIEGWEYRVLPALLEDADRVNGMVIEFHRCDHEWETLQRVLGDVRRNFHIVHVHANNFAPFVEGTQVRRTLEVTFLNKKMLEDSPVPSRRSYPLADLDSPCDPARPDFPLVF